VILAGVIAALILCLILFTAGCSPGSSVIRNAERGGCVNVAIEYQPGATRTVLSISARECHHDGSGRDEVLPAAEALDVLARSAWTSRGPRFDLVFATVYRVAENPRVLRARDVEMDRAALAARWGPRPADLDTGPAPAPDRGGGVLWAWMFSGAALVWLLVLVAYVRAVRTGHVMIIFLRM
jgi:hypothetical protein